MKKCLFASSEAYPLIKTGGLGDVSGSLPVALHALKRGKSRLVDVRLVIPAYPDAVKAAGKLKKVAELHSIGAIGPVNLLEGKLPGSDVTLWLVDAPQYFNRAGGPYADAQGNDWPDNASRFSLFCRAVCELAIDNAGLDWRADVVHAHDWQTGLVPALLSLQPNRPATVFTIHNLAYQGVYSAETFFSLSLPQALWTMFGLEYYGNMCFLKGGIAYADAITAVSPTYAEEIQRPEFGFGLDGLLKHRSDVLSGILNGIDTHSWDPSNDAFLTCPYDSSSLENKQANKTALQKILKLPVSAGTPLLGFIGRLVWQKGIDVLVDTLPKLMKRDLQFVVLGSGEAAQQAALKSLAKTYPDKLAVIVGYNEELSHQIEAGCDMFTMLSRYEPCGLNQIYSLRYGTIPIVSRTGGLADTVTDSSDSRQGTGFTFEPASASGFIEAVDRALALYPDTDRWQTMMRRGMSQDFSWGSSARQYLHVYNKVCPS